MKIRCAPIRTFASRDALTMREWEALGRFAVRIESELPKHLEVGGVDRMSAHVQIVCIKDCARPEIRSMMEAEGLNPRDWYIYIEPKLPEGAPLPQHVEGWVFHMRLVDEVSSAKRRVAGDTEKKHEPTLAEQFGKE